MEYPVPPGCSTLMASAISHSYPIAFPRSLDAELRGLESWVWHKEYGYEVSRMAQLEP